MRCHSSSSVAIVVATVAAAMLTAACGAPSTPAAAPAATKQPPGGTAAAPKPAPQPPPAAKPGTLQMRLGPLKGGLDADAVRKLLGEPSAKGKDEHWDAIGTWVQTWKYAAAGVTLEMESAKQGGAKSVYGFTIAAPCQFKSPLGIGIGSTRAAVEAQYARFEDKEAGGEDSFVAGSAYDGMFFSFENGIVVTIFVGAGAE